MCILLFCDNSLTVLAYVYGPIANMHIQPIRELVKRQILLEYKTTGKNRKMQAVCRINAW